MSADLPPRLAEAIETEVSRAPMSIIRQGSAALTRHYRSGRTSAKALRAAGGDVIAGYLAARMPATFAAISAALAMMEAAEPDFAPASLLDAGCGPGTATWAAAEIFPTLQSARLIDQSEAFLDVAARLAEASDHPVHKHAQYARADIARSESEPADLVIAGYVLAEMETGEAASVALGLWRATAGALILIEPGTPGGFERIRAAREALIGSGASILAPCPGEEPCPMSGDDWCHFSQRLARRRLHMRAKEADVPFEDERFAFVAAARFPPKQRPAARIIAPPLPSKVETRFKLCAGGAAAEVAIQKRDRPASQAVRRLGWGDPFPGELLRRD